MFILSIDLRVDHMPPIQYSNIPARYSPFNRLISGSPLRSLRLPLRGSEFAAFE